MSGDPLAGQILKSATGVVTNAAADSVIIAAPAAGEVIRVLRGSIMVTLAATGGTGIVSLEDGAGGTKFVKINADALKEFSFDLGPRGFALTSATALNLAADGAGTNEASATVTLVYYEVS